MRPSTASKGVGFGQAHPPHTPPHPPRRTIPNQCRHGTAGWSNLAEQCFGEASAAEQPTNHKPTAAGPHPRGGARARGMGGGVKLCVMQSAKLEQQVVHKTSRFDRTSRECEGIGFRCDHQPAVLRSAVGCRPSGRVEKKQLKWFTESTQKKHRPHMATEGRGTSWARQKDVPTMPGHTAGRTEGKSPHLSARRGWQVRGVTPLPGPRARCCRSAGWRGFGSCWCCGVA